MEVNEKNYAIHGLDNFLETWTCIPCFRQENYNEL